MSTEEEKTRKMAFPNAWVIVAAMIAVVAILSWIVPSGSYDYQTVNVNGTERNVAIEGTYHVIEKSETTQTGFLGIFSAMYRGCVQAADIIFVTLCCAGTFGIMVKTGAFHAGIGTVLKKTGEKSLLLAPVLFLLFGIGASALGMLTEFYGFYPLVIGLFVALGYDAMTGFAIIALGEYIGFMGATLNPYTVAVAQSVAGVTLYSGLGFRVACFLIFLAISCIYTIRYARKVKKNPQMSIVRDHHCVHAVDTGTLNDYQMNTRNALVLLDLLITLVVLIIGLIKWSWGYKELCGLFILMSVIGAALSGWTPNHYCDEFVDSAKNVVWGIILIGLAKGIMVVMNDSGIIDTIVYALSGVLKGAPKMISAQLMLLVQTILNFPINSGSGQAVVTMPIMAPLADAVGISRQVACLAFQFGDGLTNLLWPTGGIVIACGIGDIPYEKWLKWFIPLFFILYVVQMVILGVAVAVGI